MRSINLHFTYLLTYLQRTSLTATDWNDGWKIYDGRKGPAALTATRAVALKLLYTMLLTCYDC